MYAASVPVCQRYLGQLAHMLNLAEAHAARQALDVTNLLQARLAPDMLPLALQGDIAAHFALRACAPLAGLEVPDFGEHSGSFEQLQARIRRNQAFLDTLTPELMEDGALRSCSSQAGQALVTLPGDVFLCSTRCRTSSSTSAVPTPSCASRAFPWARRILMAGTFTEARQRTRQDMNIPPSTLTVWPVM